MLFERDALRTLGRHLGQAQESLLSMGHRSLLALLGIVVGSASVVALLDIGRSASEDSMRVFKGLGTDTLVVGFPGFANRQLPLPRVLDTRQMLSRLNSLIASAPISQYSIRLRRAGAHFDGSVIGTTAALPEVMDLKLASGRFISNFDGNELFVVLGAEVAAALNILGQPLLSGDSLRIGDYQFQIIGVLAAQPHNPLLPLSVDSSVFIPAHSTARLSPAARTGNVIAKARPNTDLTESAKALEFQLSGMLGGREVSVQVPRQLLDGFKRQAETFAWLLAGIGGISLMVAGVGVMNVMLMSVRERRREIGIRMSLGARPSDIYVLFLVEAGCLSLLGALLGALTGCMIAYLFSRASNWPTILSLDAVLVGVGTSLCIGLLSGCYPAVVAARLSPAKALRED
ncbi:ABC transporter permease [Pseudomonas sp. efr-133-TYG-103a]|uniref:ABC transporter permease n=1 Tax=Pseudomonas sp. efr-133-TYG-103a TaxID=3040308 RepID=UPI0025542795|nr:ABC transporter permease [Pseudomonas sp. efr-133-TYG-103a]